MKSAVFLFVSWIAFCAPADNNKIPNDSIDAFRASVIGQFMIDCEFDILLTTTEGNADYLYQAQNSIRVQDNYRILANSESHITMKAGHTIILKPSTAVLRGNHYLARIEGCQDIPPCQDTAGNIPRGISPNGDGSNDSFDLSAFCVERLTIFNRYGIIVYEALDYVDEWRGQSENGELPTGTYYYSITQTNGESVTGWVYLLREID